MDAKLERLAREFPSLASELRQGEGQAAPVPPPQAESRAEPPPPATVTPRVAQLAKQFPSLANELLGQEPPAQHQEAAPKPAEVRANGPGPAPLGFEAPEGFNGAHPIFAEFKTLAGELGLDNDKAVRVLELYRRDLQEQDKAWREQVATWRGELERDTEIQAGADTMREFVQEFGGKEFIEALGDLGDHPAIIRGLVRMAAAMRRGW